MRVKRINPQALFFYILLLATVGSSLTDGQTLSSPDPAASTPVETAAAPSNRPGDSPTQGKAPLPASQQPEGQPVPMDPAKAGPIISAPVYPPSPATPLATPATEFISSQHKALPQTALNFANQNYPRNDANKEVLDYGDDFMDAMFFVQTEREAGADAAKQVESMLAKHHNHDELHAYLLELSQKYPEVTRLYSIGESVEGRKLWALEISEEPGVHKLLKPEVNYVANIHGNEVVGREMLLHLARLLLENYSAAKSSLGSTNDSTPSVFKFAQKLLRSTRIHILPTANPDGYAKSEPSCTYETPSKRGRLNANNVDLNRNFPDPILQNKKDAATQPEVKALMDWSKSVPFVLSASIHGGALVASIPYDGSSDPKEVRAKRPSPDDDVFRHLGSAYATSHPTMSKGGDCYDTCSLVSVDNLPSGGVVIGSEWYSLYGGMQDWLYEHTSCLAITLEIGCNMYPDAKSLPTYWQFNKKPLLNFIKQAHLGIKGTVADAVSGKLLAGAIVQVSGRNHNVTTSSFGDYFRILLPGHYSIDYIHTGYETKRVFVSVGSSMASIVDIKLDPVGEHSAESQPSIIGPDGTETSKPTLAPQPDAVETKDHSLVVATLVMTTITVLMLLALAGAYVIQKRRFARSQSVSLELQPTRANLSTTGTGVSLPIGQSTSGSSANQHLSA